MKLLLVHFMEFAERAVLFIKKNVKPSEVMVKMTLLPFLLLPFITDTCKYLIYTSMHKDFYMSRKKNVPQVLSIKSYLN